MRLRFKFLAKAILNIREINETKLYLQLIFLTWTDEKCSLTPPAVSTLCVDKRLRFFCHYNYATFLWHQEEENCWQDRCQSPRKLGENYELWTGGCASAAERWILCCCSSWCCSGKRVSAFTYASCCAFERTNAHRVRLIPWTRAVLPLYLL